MSFDGVIGSTSVVGVVKVIQIGLCNLYGKHLGSFYDSKQEESKNEVDCFLVILDEARFLSQDLFTQIGIYTIKIWTTVCSS